MYNHNNPSYYPPQQAGTGAGYSSPPGPYGGAGNTNYPPPPSNHAVPPQYGQFNQQYPPPPEHAQPQYGGGNTYPAPPPQQQPNYGGGNTYPAPPAEGDYSSPGSTHQPPPPLHHQNQSNNAMPAAQPYYDSQPAPPRPSAAPTAAAPPPTAAAASGSPSSRSNPFGIGELPKVTPVSKEMRWQRAVDVAQRYLNEHAAQEQAKSVNGPIVGAIGTTRADAEALALKALNEHNHPQLEMLDNLEKHEDRLGSGILYLFSFIRFLLLLSLLFAVFQCITFGDYIRRYSPDFNFGGTTTTGEKVWLDNFMISVYPNVDHDRRLWMACNIICIIFTFFSAPLYFWYLRRGEKTSTYVDEDGEDIIIRFSDDGRIDVRNVYRGRMDVILRRIFSVTIVLVFIGIQVVSSYFITQNAVTNIGISFAISVVVAALNALFMMIAENLTEFECWTSFEKWKRFHTLKLLFFKFANIITVFAAKRYDSSENIKCAYDVIGQQLITLLVIDIFAINLQQLIVKMLWNKYSHVYASVTGSIFGDQDNLPKFDIAVEYLQISYRQYLVIMAMVVMPFSIFLSIVGYAIDYVGKKFILIKLSGVPRKVESSQKSLLTFVLLVVALCGLLTPYAGSMFMLTGLTRDKSNFCNFP